MALPVSHAARLHTDPSPSSGTGQARSCLSTRWIILDHRGFGRAWSQSDIAIKSFPPVLGDMKSALSGSCLTCASARHVVKASACNASLMQVCELLDTSNHAEAQSDRDFWCSRHDQYITHPLRAQRLCESEHQIAGQHKALPLLVGLCLQKNESTGYWRAVLTLFVRAVVWSGPCCHFRAIHLGQVIIESHAIQLPDGDEQ